MKKILSVFLSLMMAMGACAINAFAAESYTRIENLNELQDGGKYLLVCRHSERDGEYYLMEPEVVEKDNGSGVRVGFDAVQTIAFGEDKKTVEGDYANVLWTFTKSGDGWLIGNGEKYTAFTDTQEYSTTATLENVGNVFTIETGKYNYTYNFISGENSFNHNKRGLFNGYKKEENPAPFYIYKSASAASEQTKTVGLVASLKYDTTKTGVKFNVEDNLGNTGFHQVSYATLANTEIQALAEIKVGLKVTEVPKDITLTATAELYE